MTEKLLRDATMLWATIDPIGTVSLFVALAAGMDARRRRRIAVKAVLLAAVVLVGSVVAGQLILNLLGVELESFQIAGGLILFLFGVQMVFDDRLAAGGAGESGRDIAVFPLAVPSIASPGAIMAAVLLTDNSRFGIVEQAATTLVLLGVLGATLVLMLLADTVQRVLGKNGAAILVKVMGMLLSALAVEMVIEGFQKLFGNN